MRIGIGIGIELGRELGKGIGGYRDMPGIEIGIEK